MKFGKVIIKFGQVTKKSRVGNNEISRNNEGNNEISRNNEIRVGNNEIWVV